MSKKDAAKLLGLTLDEYESVLYQTAHQWGITKERERIIKLLEEQTQKFLIPEWDSWLKQEVVNFDIDGFIALIKGENK